MADVPQEALQGCQEAIGYSFEDLTLLVQALTHSSVATTRAESNERLEFLGDMVLGLAVCHDLYDHSEDLMEGDMTKVKSTVVSRQTCAEVARDLGVCEYLSLGKGMSQRGEIPLSVAAAVFESIIGAIYLDGGLEPARDFVLKYIRPYIDEALANQHQRNYKSMLQQYAQRHWSTTPEYQLLDEKGPDHSKCFEVAVTVNGKHFPSAWGMNKKQAEQEAARRALAELGLLVGEEA